MTTARFAQTYLGVNPQPFRLAVIDSDQMDGVRRLHCRYYDECLEIADERNWPSFTCGECKAFEPINARGEKRDLLGLLECAAALKLTQTDAEYDREREELEALGYYGKGRAERLAQIKRRVRKAS